MFSFLRRILGRINKRQVRKLNQIDWLRARGCNIGERVKILSGVKVDENHCWHIEIGDDVILAPNVYILAHDASMWLHLEYTRIAPVIIGNKVFIGANSTIMPGVAIGDNSIIGAGSVVTRSIPKNSVACGNPAKVISSLTAFLTRKKTELEFAPKFGLEYTAESGVSAAQIIEMKQKLAGGTGFIV